MSLTIAVAVLAGGVGQRFWPLSRRSRPKQCLSLDGGPSLLQRTVARVAPLVRPEHLLILTGPEMAAAVAADLPQVPADQLLIEPSPRSTAPALALALAEVARRIGDEAVLIVLPADHHIEDVGELQAALLAAAVAAQGTGRLVVLGLRPSRPETQYGYIQLGGGDGPPVGRPLHAALRFVEKPDLERAHAYVKGGDHLWNAGIFVGQVGALRRALRQHLPGAAAAVEALIQRPEELPLRWAQMEAISVDHGLCERMDDLLCLPCDPGWSDLGTWESAAEQMPEQEGGRALVGALLARRSHGNIVFAPGKTVALIGAEDLVIVDSPDALLVMRRDQADQLRALTDSIPPGGPR